MKRKQHSEKFKRKIVGLKLAGTSATELGEKYEVAANLIHKWAADPRYASQAPKSKPGKQQDDIKRIVAELMKGWESTLEDALRALVELAVRRKLDNIDAAIRVSNENLIKTLKGAA